MVAASAPAEVLALRAAVDAVLDLDLTGLAAGVALEHTRALLVQAQRLHAATLTAVAELDARELFGLDGAGSTRSWLAQQPAGRTGLAGEASRLCRRPLLWAALEAGQVSAVTADLVASALDRLPVEVESHQLVGVLRHAVPSLLADRGVPPEVLAGLVEDGLADDRVAGLGSAADRLEPACVLLARHLPPTTLSAELRMLVDALLPEQLADDTQRSFLEQSLHLTKRRGSGYDLRGRVDDVLGATLESALLSRLPDDATALAALAALAGGAHVAEALAAGRTAESTGADAENPAADPFGTVGPGQPVVPAPTWSDPPVEGTPRLTRDQKLVVALAALIADLTGVVPGSGSPQPVQLTVVTTLDAVRGTAGALPAQLDTPHGPVPVSAEAVQRLGCGAILTAVLLDAAGNPVGASGSTAMPTDENDGRSEPGGAAPAPSTAALDRARPRTTSNRGGRPTAHGSPTWY